MFKLQRYAQPIRRTVAGNGEEREAQIEMVQERLNRVRPGPASPLRVFYPKLRQGLDDPDPHFHIVEIRLPLRLVPRILTRT